VAARGQLGAQLGSNYARAAICGVTRNPDAHEPPLIFI
jgi:hypothetical protein